MNVSRITAKDGKLLAILVNDTQISFLEDLNWDENWERVGHTLQTYLTVIPEQESEHASKMRDEWSQKIDKGMLG